MATAPIADQLRLLDLQGIDTRGRQLQHQSKNLPVLATILEFDGQLADLDAALATSRSEASDLRRELNKAESDVEQVLTRVDRDQKRLDSGSVGAKDAQALVTELESLARRRGVLEETQLDVMERLEAHQDALGKLEEAHAKTVAARNAAVADRDSQLNDLREQLVVLKAERQGIVNAIDAGLIGIYEKLRDRFGGLAAARLEGRRCGGCRMELNPSALSAIAEAAADELVYCEECGRLLIRGE